MKEQPALDVEMLRRLRGGDGWVIARTTTDIRMEGLVRDGLAAYVRSGVLHGGPYRLYHITTAGLTELAGAEL